MAEIEKSIVVDAPLREVYNQWTQFEDFPSFMEGVLEVRQLDDKRLHWRARIGGVEKEWHAEIVDQVPDQRVAWRNLRGAVNAGAVLFESAPAGTRVTLRLVYDPEGRGRERRGRARPRQPSDRRRPRALQGVHRGSPAGDRCLARRDPRPRRAPRSAAARVSAMATYVLPDLDYDFGALEPHISGKILQLHHGKHHKGYVKKAQRDAREARRGAGEGGLLADRGPREGARLQPVGPRAALDLLEEPRAQGGGEPTGELAQRSRATSAASRRSRRSSPRRGDASWARAGRRSSGSPLARGSLTAQIYDHQSNLDARAACR